MTFTSIAVVPLSGGRRVTICRSETSPKNIYDNGDLFGWTILNSEMTAIQLAQQLAKMERVCSVEVIENDGHGVRVQK